MRLLGWLLCLALGAAPAMAEPVLLRLGRDTYGQGWLFLDRSGRCLVATPAHVLAIGPSGALVEPVLIDPAGRESLLRLPEIPDLSLDLAFLTVEGETVAAGCSSSRASALPLDFILRDLTTAQVHTISRAGERVVFDVALRGFSVDAERGSLLLFDTIGEGPEVTQGMSGSPVIADSRPIAMVIRSGPIVAIRFDLIGELAGRYRPAAPPPAVPEAGLAITLLSGRLADPATDPDALVVGGSPVAIAPERNRIALLLRLDEPRRLTGVRLVAGDLRTAMRLERLIVSTAGSDSISFAPALSCNATGRVDPAFDCRLAPRIVGAVRLELIPTPGTEEVSLGRIRLGLE